MNIILMQFSINSIYFSPLPRFIQGTILSIFLFFNMGEFLPCEY